MTTHIQPAPDLPPTEAEVIRRLTIRPESIQITATIDDESGHARHWVVLRYKFRGKLGGVGRFLSSIAADVWEAGGAVVGFVVPSVSELRPNNDHPDNYDPSGQWTGLCIEARMRTRAALNDQRASFEEAIRDIARQHRKGTGT